MPDFLLILIPLLPLIAVCWIALGYLAGWNRGEKGELETSWISLLSNSISLFLLIATALIGIWDSSPGYKFIGTWLESGTYSINISLLFDKLSISFAVVISLITLIVTHFSVNYLHREDGFQRFFMVLSLFSSGMLLVVLAGNAILTFIGWEMIGISSYLLIAYSWQRNTATEGATRAFVTNRLGDAGFLFAIFIALTWFNSTEWTTLFDRGHEVSGLFVGLMIMGFVLAAIVKSAQIPFSAWITRSLEGPTPSSAIFYGSVMIHAGLFLLLRLEPLLEIIPALSYVLIFIALLTIAYGYLGGLVQTDIKSSLMFSTLQQSGIILIEIALGFYTLAMVHILAHMIWRAYQFLNSPSFMQQTNWQAAKPAPAWLRRQSWLHTASLQRFWLVTIEKWLFINPTKALAQEAQQFDTRVVDRITGTPSHSSRLSTLAEFQAFQQGQLRLESDIGKGSGFFGKTLQWISEQLEWLEERLLFQKGGGRFSEMIKRGGKHIDLIEELLSQPRHLVLLIAITLVVIL